MAHGTTSPDNTLPLKQLLISNVNLETSAKENFSQSRDWTRVFSQDIFPSTFCIVKYNWKDTNNFRLNTKVNTTLQVQGS